MRGGGGCSLTLFAQGPRNFRDKSAFTMSWDECKKKHYTIAATCCNRMRTNETDEHFNFSITTPK